MRTVLIGIALLAGAASVSAYAQERKWDLTPEIGFSHFSGTARDETTTPHVSASPSPSMSVGVRVDRAFGQVRVAMTLLYEETGLVEGSSDVTVTANNVLKLFAIHPEMSLPLFRVGNAAIRAHAGVAIDRWGPADEKARTRFGLLAGLGLESPLSRRVSLAIRWEGTSGKSMLIEDDLPAGFELRNTFHSRLGLGIRLGL
jgi:opacity protein-like surface antigen